MLFDDFSFATATHFGTGVAELAHNPVITGPEFAELVHDPFFELLRGVRSHLPHPTSSAPLTIASTDSASDDAIYVVGNKITYDPPAGDPDGNQQNNFSGIPADGGGGGSYPDPKPTPCVETTFSTPGVSLTEANRAALAASRAIAALNDETYEYSSIIFTLNGYVGFTNPYTDRSFESVNFIGGLASVPDGAVIIGIVHNHPDDPVMTDTIPSGGGADGQDWQAYSELVNFNSDSNPVNLPRGISVDRNMLLYIYSNEDGKTHVYDNTDKNQRSPSCTLQ